MMLLFAMMPCYFAADASDVIISLFCLQRYAFFSLCRRHNVTAAYCLSLMMLPPFFDA